MSLLASQSAIHSGHSLTDAYVNGTFRDVFVSAFPGTATQQHHKSTIPGSSTWIRWDAPDGTATEGMNPKDHMAEFDLLMITERGLDSVGVAPITHEVMLEDILYLTKFVNRAAASEKQVTLWSIWPSYNWAGWQDMLDDYEVRFKLRQQYVNWKIKQLRPDWTGKVWIAPGHRFMQHLLNVELPPGISTYQEMFRDDIHPNTMLEHGLGLFVLTYLYQQDMRPIETLLPAFVTAEQDTFFKRISWEILSAYAEAGMGGTADVEVHWDGHDWYPSATTPAELEAATIDQGVMWEPPPAEPIDPETVAGYVTSIPEIVATGSPTPLASLAVPLPAGAFYGIMAVAPDATQPGSAALMLTLRNGGTNVASLNLRTDLDGILFENDPSGGNHANANQSTLTGKLVVEFWIGAGGGFVTVNGKEYTSLGMIPASVDAVSYRVGEGGWGPEPFSGTIHRVALFSGKPSDADRAGMRSWAKSLASGG